MKCIWVLILCLILDSGFAASIPKENQEASVVLGQFKVVELTHLLTPEVPTWNGSCGFCLEIKKDYDQMFRVQQMKMHAGVGTHMDAPSHCIQGGFSIADIPLEKLIVPACVIDVSAKADADYEVSIENIAECSQVPARGSYVIALPLRVEDATESPIRIIGLIHN